MPTTLINLRKTKRCDVRIDRHSIFGNPFKVGADGDRKQVLQKYKDYFYHRLEIDDKFREQVDGLKGKILGCWCFPDLCHGMVIIEYLDGIPYEQNINNPPSFFDS